MSEIVVPKWGLTTDEVIFGEWYKQVGDTVKIDEPVAEVESDKAIQEIVSQVEGTITALLVTKGDELSVGQAIAEVEP